MNAQYLELYEAIGGASRRMRDAARAAEWPALIAAESECAALIERARAAPAPALAPDEQRRRHEIIRGILADDAEIRDCVTPWMAELEDLIAGSTRGRLARDRYGA